MSKLQLVTTAREPAHLVEHLEEARAVGQRLLDGLETVILGQDAVLSGVVTALIAAGELLLPTSGAAGLLTRTALWLLYPLALLATGFFTPAERRWLFTLRHPSELIRRARAFRPAPAAVDGSIPESAEAELLDEDARW